MALHISPQELVARVHLGKPVEQWLLHIHEVDYTVIKWISLDREEKQFGLTYFESFDEGEEGFYDVHEFSVLDPEDVPFGITHVFETAEAAVAFAVLNYGASPDRFVTFGMIAEEYRKYLQSKNSFSQLDESVFRCLYNELMLRSGDGTAEIERYWIALTEASKCSGRPKEDVRNAFLLFEEQGLIQKADEEKLTYIMTQLSGDREKVKRIISRFHE